MSYPSIRINKSQIDFVKTNFSCQIQALTDFYPIIKSAISQGVPQQSIKFGGGTALAMYYFGHRLSFDIDLFVENRQYLSFFNPKIWIDDYDNFNSDEYRDDFNHIGVVTKDGIKIDILPDENSNKCYLDSSKDIFDFNIYIESIEDIIAKKIAFRKTDNKTRDIFDIAVVANNDEELLNNLTNKGKVTIQDLLDFKIALENLNLNKYNSQIKIIEPISKYQEIASKAPKIIIDILSTYLGT